MNIQKAYDHWAVTYDSDANLTRDLDQTATAEALANLHFETILEVGCGTGKNTAFFLQVGERVIALDFSEGMLKKAKEKLGSTNVLFCMADVTRTWPCEASSVDLVTCNLVLEHVEDLTPVFAEAHRILIDGGRLFVSELHPFRQYQGKKARFEQGQKEFEIDAFVHHISEFFEAAISSGFALRGFREWWHDADEMRLPRLVSFIFQK
jgi:ubiquinone/menaquinone biosynthesis C-methylase UbiE